MGSFVDTVAGATYVVDLASDTVLTITGSSGVSGGWTPADVEGEVTITYNFVPVPEASSLAFAGIALVGLGLSAFRRRRC